MVLVPDMEWVEEKRITLKLSREDLRDLLLKEAGIKVSMKTINTYCQGKGNPQFRIVKALVELLDGLESTAVESNGKGIPG